MKYKYIKEPELREGGGVGLPLVCPIKCNFDYFIEAFWVPIRRQIGKKLVMTKRSDREVVLWRNSAVTLKNNQHLSREEFAELVRRDTEEVLNKAMRHIDRIMAYMYGDETYGEERLVPFIDTTSAIKSIEEATITMNGRLPMQEDYFIESYWRPLVETYRSSYPGVQFGIHFSDAGTKITPSLAFRERDAKAKKYNVSVAESPDAILQVVACDLADAVLQAAAEYAEACK